MMEDLSRVIQSNFGALSEQELTTLLSYCREEKLSRGDLFVSQGTFCRRLSLIRSGLLRIYGLANGKETTQWISTPGYFITEIPSFFFEMSSRWTIEALTDVELLTIDKSNCSLLCRDFPKWHEIEKQFIAKCFAMLEDRVFTHLSMTAEERYIAYFKQHAELFNQVPLQYLASSLGMSAETFSRIRSKLASSS